jgi:hypothetical protein
MSGSERRRQSKQLKALCAACQERKAKFRQAVQFGLTVTTRSVSSAIGLRQPHSGAPTERAGSRTDITVWPFTCE